ncbi:MAG: hypothetical protein WBE86_11060 [Candidatus Acidiferrales bacterium]
MPVFGVKEFWSESRAVLGDEIDAQATLKRLADGVQEKIAEAALLDYIRR